jgi:predicted alpha/beta-fold hydrolase
MVSPEIVKAGGRFCVMSFDKVTRAAIFGYKSTEELYTANSCKNVLEHIDKPFMIFHNRSDAIILDRHAPKDILRNNPHCLMLETDFGGHCGFTSMYYDDQGQKQYERSFPPIAVNFIKDLDRFQYL